MITHPHIPTRGALIACIGQLSNREVLGVTEVTDTVRTLIVPLLRHSEYDTAELSMATDGGDITAIKRSLDRFIQQEERSLINQMAVADADHQSTCESLIWRAANVKLMHLIAEMSTHQDDTIV